MIGPRKPAVSSRKDEKTESLIHIWRSASFTPLTNFAYQLDCVAQIQRSCAGYADYVKLWRETLKIDPAT